MNREGETMKCIRGRKIKKIRRVAKGTEVVWPVRAFYRKIFRRRDLQEKLPSGARLEQRSTDH